MHPRSRTIHRGRKFDLELVVTPGPGGEPIEREVVRHPGAVCILPLLDSATGPRVIMVRNMRIAAGARILELPAGTLEPMEKPEECAPRELAEETGYEAAAIRFLTKFYTSPGMSDEVMWAFIATGLRRAGPGDGGLRRDCRRKVGGDAAAGAAARPARSIIERPWAGNHAATGVETKGTGDSSMCCVASSATARTC
ncbi:MAG: NUDIX hydrolase [Phycisphaerales bacterium]|nr:NUDIX hydrolase [Phycisphaerales bacterium]